jgi:gamma-glutamyltranspeptidase/glutathione hydrolase
MAVFDWELPYPSQREGVLADNVIATSQPLAAQAGLAMLRAGGNAVDAAVAAAAALTVVEPTSNGIGGDAFAIVSAGDRLHGLNASGRAPMALRPEHFAGQRAIPETGWAGVTVPGAVSAWAALAEPFGVLPFEQLMQPAIEYAREGFLVSRQTAEAWREAEEVYRGFDSWLRTFCPDGRAPEPGERFRSDDHASTLEAIAASRGEAFYRGTLAERIATHAAETGGMITADDLAAHQPEWVTPLSVAYRDYELHEIPPNGQGLAVLIALGILRHFDMAQYGPDTAAGLHLQIEAMKLAFADAHRYVADREWMDVDIEELLLNSEYLESRAAVIDSDRAALPDFGTPRRGGTVYLAAADASGMMVSYIQSNWTGFGSGIVVPGTGIAMHNRGCGFTLEPGHPNEVGGGKRPYHTIIPGFLTRGGESVMAFGVMGGAMQPQGHVQVVVRTVDHGQNPQAALDAPRWRVVGGRTVSIERGLDEAVYEGLRRRGHEVEVAPRTVAHGGGQAISRLDDGYFGASDLRRDGQAVGF